MCRQINALQIVGGFADTKPVIKIDGKYNDLKPVENELGLLFQNLTISTSDQREVSGMSRRSWMTDTVRGGL